MVIFIDEWVKSIKSKIRLQVKDTPTSFKRFVKRFNSEIIRETIYDYLEENIQTGMDGYPYIIVRTKDGSDSAVIKIYDYNEDRLICEENEELRKRISYITKLRLKCDETGQYVYGVTLSTMLGYKEW